jgi:hypothetical protein
MLSKKNLQDELTKAQQAYEKLKEDGVKLSEKMQELQDAGTKLNQKGFYLEGVIEYLNDLILREEDTKIVLE